MLPIAAGALLLSCSAGGVSGDVSRAGSAQLAFDAVASDRPVVGETTDATSTIQPQASRVSKTRPASAAPAPPDPHSGQSPSAEFSASEATPLECALDGVAFAECSDSPASVGTFGTEDDPTVSIDDITVGEDDTQATFTVFLSAAATSTVTVDYTTDSGSATSGDDFQATNGTLTFDPGITSQPINVPVIGDLMDESDEDFTVTLSGATAATILDGIGTGTITDDDAAPSISVDDVTTLEGDAGTTDADFTVTLSNPSANTITVDYASLGGSAISPDDFGQVGGELSFAPGDTSETITVAVVGDTLDEADEESFGIEFSNAVNASVDDTGLGTITDDDAEPTMSIDDVTVTEGDADTTLATFTVTLSTASGRDVSADYTTIDDTAAAGTDYIPRIDVVNFVAGQTTSEVAVEIYGDLADEADETFTLFLSNPSGAMITDDTGIGTITDDDAAPAISIDDRTVAEGANAVFTVSLDHPSASTVTVDYVTANGTATAPGDYGAQGNELTFAPGDTSKTITVSTVDDALDEALSETFSVVLSGATNATIADTTGDGTITDNDAPPTLSINDQTVNEGDVATFTVTLSAASALSVTVDFASATGTASASDFTAANGTLTFTPGQTTKTVLVTTTEDPLDEADTESYSIALSNPDNAAIADGSGSGTITDDDPEPSISINDVTVPEGNAGTTNAVFTVSLSAATTKTVTVEYATDDGTAGGADYAAAADLLMFNPGDTAKTVTVPVNGDLIDEGNETFVVNLTDPINATVPLAEQGVGTITDDDPTPSLTIDDVTVTEGDTGAVNAIFTVSLSNPSSSIVSVNYASLPGSATSPADFAAASGTLNFSPGELTKTVPVAVQGDLVYEGNETFTLGLSGAVNATIADFSATGTISENDPLPVFSVNDVTVTEGNGGTASAVFTVTIAGARSLPASVSYATANGSATAGSDYTAVSGTHTFAVGETSKTVTVTVQGDNLHEADETFTLTLSSPSNAALGDGSGVGTIANDDMAPRFSIDDVSVSEAAASAVFTVTRNRDSQLTVSVDAATANNTATAGSDYTAVPTTTLTFIPGDMSETVTVPLIGDALDEPDEMFFVNLSNAVVATITDGQGVGTILDDDASPTLSIDDRTVTEGAAASFTVTLSASSPQTVTVNYASVTGSATAPADFGAVSGTLSFAPGETSKTIPVSTVDDAIDENDEAYTIELATPSAATILDGIGLGTIADDDPEPSLSIGDVTVAEDDTNATFTVTLAAVSGRPVTVGFATANAGATAGSDYTATSGTLSFAAGETTKQVTVPVADDALDEGTESFTVNLSGAANATIADGEGSATITDNDAPPTVSIADASAGESAGTLTLTASLSAPSGHEVSVAYATANGDATAGSDYTAKSGGLTFAPGETSKQITVAVTGDALDEENETFAVNLSGPVNATTADGDGVATILDDDPLPSLSINDVTVTEGNSGTTTATFTVTLSPGSGRPVSVDYTTSDSGAAAPSDYTTTAGTLTFAVGETTKTVTVPVNGDSVNEGTETYNLDLSNAPNATITDSRGVGTILDDDGAPTLAVNDVTVLEGDTGSVAATFTVSLTAASGQTVSVGYSTANESAVAPGDYAGTGGNLVFAPGQTAHTVTVDVNGDLLDEENESFRVNLSNPVNAAIADAVGVGNITDNDALPDLRIGDASVIEGNTGSVNASFAVTLGVPSGRPVTVDFSTTNAGATQPADYASTVGSLTFGPGETTKTVLVPVNGDLLDEENETFFVDLSNRTNADFGDSRGVGTITDDDPMPTLAVSDATVTEGHSGTVNADFTVSLNAPSGRPVSVGYVTADVSASAADYTGGSGTVNFAPGETTKTVSIAVNGDALNELNETFTMSLSSPTNATFADATATGTITDDDPLPTLAINDVTVAEGDTGSVNAVFTVSLSAPSGRIVTVNFGTAGGSATAPADFAATSGTLNFAPGETTKTIPVAVNGDVLDEFDETFAVNLSSESAATLADAAGTGTITDDDAEPSLSISDVTVPEGQSGTVNANLTVTLSAPSAKTVTVDFATADGTATAGVDYQATTGTLTFAPGLVTRFATVPVTSDTRDELDEDFTVTLSNPVHAPISDALGFGTITDDDAPPTVSVDDVAVTEGDSGTTTATFTVGLSAPSGLGVTVGYSTTDVSAASPADYLPATGTLSFAAGETTKQVAVTINGDILNEVNEMFTFNLANPTNASLGDGSATGTITNDDPVPTLAINDVTIVEGDTGSASAVFTVTLSSVSGRTVTANYATINGDAAAPADYLATSGALNFAPGETTKSIGVTVNSDLLDEANETFSVNLSGAVGATFADASGQGVITDDDATPSLTINDVPVVEGNSGTTPANFTVTLSAPSGRPVTVSFATASGTALAGSDYVASSGATIFAPGETSKTLSVSVNGDTLAEASETYFLNLPSATNATIADDQGVGTIIDDDGDPVLFVNDLTVTEGNSGTVNANFTVSLSAASGQNVSVGFSTADDTATAGPDYTTHGGSVVFSPGVTTRPVTVQVKSDTLDEIDETFFVNLTDPLNADIADGQGVGTITDDDSAPSVAVNNVTVTEGNAGTTAAVFTVTLNAPSGKPIAVDYLTSDETATAPSDYAAASGTLAFAAGETTKTVTVNVNGDALNEITETFTLGLTNATNAVIGDPSGVGTITDDDPLPTLAINDVTLTEGDAGNSNAVFTVSLSGASGRTVSVNYATANGSALAPGDYTAGSGILSFAPGETTKTVTVPVIGDLLDEEDETFTVVLSGASGATIADASGLGTITDNDAPPSLSVNDVTVTEGNTGTVAANFTVSLSAPSGRPVSVKFATANGSAFAPGDYVARGETTLGFVAGETSKQVAVTVNGDLLDEVSETYFLALSAPTNATLADEIGVGTIIDDDGQPTIAIDDVTLTEGNGGTANAVFTLTLSGASGQSVSVGYSTENGTATSGSDYVAAGGNVFFAAGDTSEQLTVQVTSDILDELDETFLVNLSGAINATIADNQGVGTIADDDDAPTISIGDVSVAEGNGGTTNATFNVTLSRASGLPINVDYATVNVTATAGVDYQAKSGSLSFAAGQTSQQVTVLVTGDLLDEEPETYVVNLSNVSGASIADNQAVGTITDDDPAPTVSVNDLTIPEGNSGTTGASFTVTLSAASGRAISVAYATADGTASAADYTGGSGTLDFAPGETAKTVPVSVNGDVLHEINETFTIALSGPTNASLGDGVGLGTITDDDAAPSLSIDDVSVSEGNSGTASATFTVSLSAVSGRLATVNFATGNGTAIAPGDYAATSGSLSFAAGETTKTVSVTVNGDLTDEANEAFVVNLATAVNATIADGQGVGTIVDDDGFPSLSVDDVTVTEGQSGSVNANFTVSLSNPSGQTVTVDYSTVAGTATAGADYEATSGTLTFAPGALTRPVTVSVTSDMLDEVNEVYTLNLSNVQNATMGDGIGLGTITDDDAEPSLAVNDVAVTEGNGGTTAATFTVSLNAPSGRAVSVGYATANGSATAPADYDSASGTLDFAAGQTTKTFAVTVKGDALNEINETFAVNLAGPVNAAIADGAGVGTINDDDPLPSLAINDVTVTEGNSGITDATFTVTLSTVSGRTVTANFATGNGTATTPADYAAASGALSFAAGETSKTVTVQVSGDVLDEENETFTVGLTAPFGASIGDGSGTATITDDDAVPSLSITDVTVVEGNTGTTPATFTVNLSAPSGRTVTVGWTTTNGTAIAPSDYAGRGTPATLTFAPGDTSEQLTVSVNGDVLDETTETYSVNLAGETNATLVDAQGVGTIIDDDGEPVLSINDVTVTEGNSGTGNNATFTVTLSATSGQSVSVHYATADGTAAAGSDYTAVSGDLVFNPGQTTKTIQVPITSEVMDELDETFTVALSDPTNATIVDAVGLATITDDDAPPTLSVSDVTLAEGNTGTANATFTVSLARASALGITVDYATAEGSASAPSDYTGANGTLSFAPGDVSKQVTIAVKGDALNEATETFTLNLSNAVNATILDGSGTGTITNDDPLPALSIGDATVTEGNSGTVNATFTVSLSTASGRAVSVDYATATGSATAPADFTATNGTLAFAAGETTKIVAVTVNGDALDEIDETFTVNLSNHPNAEPGDVIGLGTITDDDLLPALSIANATVTEGNSGTVNATFTVSLTPVSGRSITVSYATANGTASAADYTPTTGTLTFAAGETTKTIPIAVNGDLLNEDNETFSVTLSAPTNATLAAAGAVGTITDDDGTPSFSIADVTSAEGQSGGVNASFDVTLNAPSGKTITVAYATEDGTATAAADYDETSGTLTFAPGITSRTITVRVTGDQLDEVDETFTVRLSSPTNASIADPLGLGTITDDDAPPTLSVDNVTVAEGNAGAVNATFTVELSAPSGKAISVGHATADGDATAPADYTSSSGPLSFAAGATTKTVTVAVQGDTLDEVSETYTLNLSGASNATILDGTGVGTITDDDPAPTLAVGDITLAEGNTGTTAATFTVALSAASGRTVTVNYATANGSASAPADYTSTPGSLTFAAGDTTETITVPVNGDVLDENDETFVVNLSGAVGASVTDAQGVATITDDDPLPTLAVGDVTVVETDTGTAEANFTVTLNAQSGRTVTVDFFTANGTAVAATGDYTGRTGALSFAPSETTKTVTVNVNGDLFDEVSETYFLKIEDPTNATIADGEGVGTIIDNDGLPSVFINDVSVVEGNSGTANANFTVSLSAASGQNVTVGYATADGTASAAVNDYTAGGGNLSFAPGQTTRTVTVPVRGDTTDEPDETFTVDLSAPGNADIADDQGVGTIADDDAPPTLSVTDPDVTEGDADTTVAATFTVRLNAASAKPVTVDFATADGTAAAPTDYAAVTGALSFAAGETTKDVSVVVSGDAVNELNETFALNLTNAVNASIVDGGVGTILNDDPLPAVSVADVMVPEGNAGTTIATFTVTINRLSSRTVTVDYATANRSAITPDDYDAVSGSLTFEPGQTTKTVGVPVHGDGVVEPDESFVVNLSNVVAGSMADNQAVGTIANDDAAPPPPPPPPPPPAPPPPPPPGPDTTAPGEVTNLRVTSGDGIVTLAWTNPSEPDFAGVSVKRIQAGKTVQNLTVYGGSGRTFADRSVKNGSQYRYRIKTRDRAGNESAGVVVNALPTAALFAPLENALVTAPPMLRWKAVRGATYYNLQLYRVGRGSQAKAITATKILSAWPKVTRFKLARTWRYGGKRYTLSPGTYRWYVWPGLGKRAANKYGAMLGDSSFIVKGKTVRKKRR